MDATTAEIARRSDALKSALLDSVSHDLRTPLAAIRAAAGTLMDPTVDLPPDEGRELGRVIDREATWLDRLVSNLLDMSRLEAGEIRPDPHVFSLGDLIQSAIARVGLGGGRLTVDIPDDLPPVRVDEVFFGQVMADLLDNAVKYAGAEAPLRVSAREMVTGETVAIDVEDGGPGVPETHIERLFEKFYRVPRRDEGSRRGTGIGLAVVRGLVEAMGGTVAAGPSPLGGLAIRIEVPAAPPLDEDPPMPAARDLP
jgi:two-component system sensor histidine kinase KdpD